MLIVYTVEVGGGSGNSGLNCQDNDKKLIIYIYTYTCTYMYTYTYIYIILISAWPLSSPADLKWEQLKVLGKPGSLAPPSESLSLEGAESENPHF